MVKKKDYSELIGKKEWTRAKDEFQTLIINTLVNLEHYKLCLENAEKKLNEFKDEVDKVVDEVIDGNPS